MIRWGGLAAGSLAAICALAGLQAMPATQPMSARAGTAPTPAARPSPRPFTRTRIVHLITGDAVRVRTREDGSTDAKLLPYGLR